MPSFHDYFRNQAQFYKNDDLFYQADLTSPIDFERSYIALRKKEGRLYEDDIVRSLPIVNPANSLSKEWRIRKRSVERISEYLGERKTRSIIEIGCGNGWLTNYLNNALDATCCGIDINEVELKQAARVFRKSEGLTFVYADICSPLLDNIRADIIVIAACAQYFKDLNGLIGRLLGLLTERGEIHILDSPFYADHTTAEARERSEKYFAQSGCPEMGQYYHHHDLKIFHTFNHWLQYDPQAIMNRVKRFLIIDSPFPWIKVTN